MLTGVRWGGGGVGWGGVGQVQRSCALAWDVDAMGYVNVHEHNSRIFQSMTPQPGEAEK